MPDKKHLIKEVSATPDFPLLEKELLSSWYQNGVVEKYLHRNDNSDTNFTFQDGPITANNPMGVHHAWGRTYKDLWQRYKNMRGYKQRFQSGFDCQGLWVEVEVEKELGFKFKKDIETYGVDKFIEHCKERVVKFSEIQTDQSKRLGYFMDWDNSYFTMSEENNYMIWHFLKVCAEKGWIYKGHDSVPWCPRCETAISQHEMLTEDYKEAVHESVFLRLPIVGRENEYLLIWTTTPWTIPANIAVTVHPDYYYRLWNHKVTGDKYYLLHSNEDRKVFPETNQSVLERILSLGGEVRDFFLNFEHPGTNSGWPEDIKGSELVGLKYKGPYDHLEAVKKVASENPETFHTVVATDPRILPISATDGTGLVHTAVSAGTEDFQLGKLRNLPMVPVIDDGANYLEGLGELSGKNAKKHPELILDYLKKNGVAVATHQYKHRYPACWRCKTELVWKVADEWYIAMDKVDPQDSKSRTLRQKMIDSASQITWKPGFGLDRELDWLNNMHDWLISKKNRYWGLALPIWVCDDCGEFEVIGGKEELKQRASAGWEKFEGHTPHKPFIDEVKITHHCGGSMSRTLDVGNPWLDAGIVPFSTIIDPENGLVSYTSDKKEWKQWFPADFVTESFPGQFKNWFYSLIAMSTVLEDTNPFKSVLGFASMLGEDGRAMHKSWGNSIEFNEAADKIGADVMRWTFVRHNPERNMLFGYKLTGDVKRQFHMLLWNSYRFFANYADLEKWEPKIEFDKVPSKLDLWILHRLDQLAIEVSKNLDDYDAFSAAAQIESFVSDLSTWYIRRSRDRVGPSATNAGDKENCYRTLRTVFDVLSRLLMPFIPFVSDSIYTNITGEESVNLADWPTVNTPEVIDMELIESMSLVRKICEMGHSVRKINNVAVKQPLAKVIISGPKSALEGDTELLQLIKDELNVINVEFVSATDLSVDLDLVLTDELMARGKIREVIRAIQEARKLSGCQMDEYVSVILPDWPVEYEEEIKQKTLVKNLEKGPEVQIIREN